MFTTLTTTDRLAARWTSLWNGELPADEVVSSASAVSLGRTPRAPREVTLRGPSALQEVVESIRRAVPGIRYGHGIAAIPASGATEQAGLFTLIWHVEAPGLDRRTGIDVLRYEAGAIAEVWSVTGDLDMPEVLGAF